MFSRKQVMETYFLFSTHELSYLLQEDFKWALYTHVGWCHCYEQSINHFPLQKGRPRCYSGCVLPKTMQASSAVPAWLGDKECYLMQKMQSDLWPYSRGRENHLQGSVSLYSCPHDSLGTGNKEVITLDNCISLTVGCCGPNVCMKK